uniref:Secreted protein n=1 Tax=Anguilla anguilla TaxID=7936 RepID=A0A0E9XL06_ANGAN
MFKGKSDLHVCFLILPLHCQCCVHFIQGKSFRCSAPTSGTLQLWAYAKLLPSFPPQHRQLSCVCCDIQCRAQPPT